MFLPWTIFVINIILSVFQFLLISALDAALAIYSRFGGEYANTIRWIRQTGYIETVSSIFNSHKRVPTSTTIAIILVAFAGIIVSITDKGVAYFIHSTEREGNTSFAMVKTTQYSPSTYVQTFTGWSTYINTGDSVVDAVSRMINDTKNIPDAIPGKLYRPRTFDYEAACRDTNLYVSSLDSRPLLGDGCTITLFSVGGGYAANENSTTFIHKSSGRWSLITPIVSEDKRFDEMSLSLIISLGRHTVCNVMDNGEYSGDGVIDGLSSLPVTIASKCVFSTGEVIALSASLIRFSSSRVQDFHNITTSAFDEHDELFQAMDVLVNGTTFLSNTTLVIEIKAGNGTIDALACYSHGLIGSLSLACLYANTNVVITKPQEINPIIAASRGNKPYPIITRANTMISIYHNPRVTRGSLPYSSISGIKNATSVMAEFLASLGQNFYMDWDDRQLYVLYDVVGIEEGIDVPIWLIVCMAIIMMICICLWGLTKLLLDSKYTNSLYKTISTQMVTRMGSIAPMLMRYNANPMRFEGVPIVPHDEPHKVGVQISSLD